jgi:predicted nicotinamide N-methyase
VSAESFVLATTRLQPAPFLPELALHLGEDIVGLWERTEAWSGRSGLPPPFWAFAWAGGLGLARYVLDHPESVRGRRVLDLATGCGVVAVAAALVGAAQVTANDVDPLALAAVRVNAEANRVGVNIVLGDLLGPAITGSPAGQSNGQSTGQSTGSASEVGPVDVVLAGDVFYDHDLATDVLPFLQRAAERGARVLIGDPGRRYLPRALLLPLDRYDVPVLRDLESTDIATVTVWWLPARAEADA